MYCVGEKKLHFLIFGGVISQLTDGNGCWGKNREGCVNCAFAANLLCA